MSLHTAPAAAVSAAKAQALADNFIPSSSPMPGSYALQMASKHSSGSTATGSSGSTTTEATSTAPKTARCKRCGLLISRSMEAIETHMEECGSVNSPHGRNASVATGNEKNILQGPDGPITVNSGMSKTFGGITRRPELENYGTRIIYRTARKQGGKVVRPREVCALQDSFIDEDVSSFFSFYYFILFLYYLFVFGRCMYIYIIVYINIIYACAYDNTVPSDIYIYTNTHSLLLLLL